MTNVIETARLRLRPLHAGDGPEIAAKINSYAIAKNLARVPFPYSPSDAEEFLDWALALDDRSDFRVISLKSQPQDLIGLISYDWVDAKQQSELGYWMVEGHWGQGLMTEAACAMVDLAFANPAITVLSSCYFNDNPASGHVLAKAGFETEGPCTHFSRSQNRDVPVTLMRLTRAHWANKKAAV